MSLLENLVSLLDELGQQVHSSRETIKVTSRNCINNNIPSSPGVYWIETTMPTDILLQNISVTTGKQKRIRVNPPEGTELIQQEGSGLYVVYSGTEENLKKRLTQHLFNQGNEGTAKLGCIVNEAPFNQYEWIVRYKEIDHLEARYAIETWWRRKKGWPKFCLR